ncbi:polysaccharide lyase 8 family protein [Clostridium tarantellae]|uniref:Silent information regulator protein Sir2 n=1 Tax=Clostridium tarantellae TaxID=39493 RepID=A0A6I1MFC2_9CLOT|nr:polysaccharide lyase 8 family protein [Clostridium tarantellae]MPQ42186.1 silent information regulator protein Sir2 [Clostridium tarantellae]
MLKSRDFIKMIIATALVSSILTTTTIGTVVSAAIVNDNSINVSKKEIKSNKEQLIEELRLKWKNDLTGGDRLDLSNGTIVKKIKWYEKQTDKLSSTINMNKSNDWLWEDSKEYKTVPAKITSMYNNILTMSMAYNLPNNKYYKNEDLKNKITYAMDWLYTNAYNENKNKYGNWWDWMIGIPAKINNITILMYDDFTETQIENYMKSIQKFLPEINPGSKYHTGANLADVCINKLLQGIISKDESKILEGSQDIISVFDYVTKGDGFYSDGSFVQHGVVAYTGSYGNVLIDKVSNILYLTEGTPWEIKSRKKDNIYKWISESFQPIIYKGYVMDMVRGRSISRYNSDGFKQASGIIQGMVKISMIAPKDMSNKIKVLVKQWAEEAKTVFDFGTSFNSINVINEYYRILKDKDIIVNQEDADHYALNIMDKTVHKRENYAFGISRSSSRITKYEFMNKENLKPWHQGDGMTYLYNNDLTQFSNNFWPTIDPYRMPGTTVDTKRKTDKKILSGINPGSLEQNNVYYELGNNDWSGGTKIGIYGVAGMQINNKNDQLKANKSWFMFDNEIVALGSAITNPDKENSTETIIENRKINKKGTNPFIIDGDLKVANLGDKDKINNVKWAYLQGDNAGADIGYYFPEGETLNIIRENRKGNWNDINSAKGDKPAENNYLTMYINHGRNIKDSKYSYVLLPGMSKNEVKNYSENSKVEIIRNDKIAQGVKHKKLNIEAANFWVDGKNTSGSITSLGKASVMTKENKDGTLTISVSDPTFKQNNLTIEINKPGIELVSSDKNISKLNFDNNKISFNVNTENAMGKSFELTVKLEGK